MRIVRAILAMVRYTITVVMGLAIVGSVSMSIYVLSHISDIGVGWPYSAKTLEIRIGGYSVSRVLSPEPSSYDFIYQLAASYAGIALVFFLSAFLMWKFFIFLEGYTRR